MITSAARARHLLVLAAALVALASSAPAEARGKARPCATKADARSPVATLRVTSSEDDEGTVHQLVSCLKRTGKRQVLATWYFTGSSTDNPAPQWWIAGRFVAINQAYCSGDPFSETPCTGSLKVIDLRARRRVATVATTDPVFDLVLTRRGSVAMIHRGQLMLVRGTEVQVLDTAAEAWSLAYAESPGTVYWTSGGQPRTATLR